MTKTEFFLKAVLALASNPKYTTFTKNNHGEEIPSLSIANILYDADKLLEVTDEQWSNAFADDNTNKSLPKINDLLMSLNRTRIRVTCHKIH